eukprot:TRINITY_DN52505_c0_g1_i1.p1 TRINITY_DN52505_c0_g1~~TRINITY_DN52505_c0_g1_i1.p1  ORF type:complete len:210 (-),score=46.26 TRINITY_DN52505_c0_g1_i1:234-863(-)
MGVCGSCADKEAEPRERASDRSSAGAPVPASKEELTPARSQARKLEADHPEKEREEIQQEKAKAALRVSQIEIERAQNSDLVDPIDAAERGDVRALQMVARGAPQDLNVQDERGRTTLFLCSLYGHVEAVELLCSTEGVNLNQPNEKGETPLYTAAEMGNEGVVEALLEAGVDVNQKDKFGTTATWIADYQGHEEVALMLKAAGGIIEG